MNKFEDDLHNVCFVTYQCLWQSVVLTGESLLVPIQCKCSFGIESGEDSPYICLLPVHTISI